uniref:RING-type E3 ubiquitin transferase n=1 Tax=Knipowitschia caucasica TaxID=637954 RepID=A0AAV2IXH8_KNICA
MAALVYAGFIRKQNDQSGAVLKAEAWIYFERGLRQLEGCPQSGAGHELPLSRLPAAFNSCGHQPISLGCSHTVCKTCLHKLHRKACPFDQTPISTDIDLLPVNCALLQLVGAQVPDERPLSLNSAALQHYEVCSDCVEEMALYLKPFAGVKGVASPSVLSRPMQRKLVTLVNCQLVEEEGRVRAVRAGRSLGERTVTELILQHQNPQQLSANLWAAVRARGCQFLGPAMQEDALKLVLLALEDGLALSRKVLVLFVVQKLEARFPQASKTSIGHVVQLLYRASCFKVTKRDEDSSLMQLKEEFRTYEALRREHDAQIVHIAMEAGLRISPEQWSSLLYGDLVHKSHMQSIIDKLQSPESFAKSVQELTIVLQRSGDPANLSNLRPNLELLANIDHNPDAPTPSWEELKSVMFSVKQVVHGLVGFIQNFSKKSNEAPQPQTNAKYKTSMCRDLRQQGGCPRGTNCTFAHTQDELEKFRLRNKKSGSHSLHIGQTLTIEGEDIGTLEDTEVLEGMPHHPQLSSRGTDSLETLKRTTEPSAANRANPRDPASGALSESPEKKSMSRSATPVNHPLASSPLNTTGCADGCSQGPKHSPCLARAPHQASGLYYQDAHSPYDAPQFQPACSFYPSLHGPQKTCMAQFLRSSNVTESLMPPSLGPPPSFPCDLHPPHPTSSLSPGYTHAQERMSHPAFHRHPGQSPYGTLAPAHGVYAPLYDSRRVWRPQLYHREDARSNSLPPEVLHSTVYQPPLKERFNSLDSNYCSPADHRQMERDYGHAPLGYEDLFRRKQEQWAHHHHHHHRHVNHKLKSSPILTMDFGTEHAERRGSPCMGCRCRGEESSAHYSPWSCLDSLTHTSTHSCSEHVELKKNNESGCSGSGVAKPWLQSLDHYQRLKDEDPIIPFSEGPIISKWGAISRASRTDFHTTDPVQATSWQGTASTTAINFNDYNVHLDHTDYRWNSRGSNSSSHSSFLESDKLDVRGDQTSIVNGEKTVSELPTCQTVYGLDEEGLIESEPGRDIELELCALDMDDSDQQNMQSQDREVQTSPLSQDTTLLLAPSCPSPLLASQTTEPDVSSLDKIDIHRLKKMAFRKSLSPAGMVSGGLGVEKSVLQTEPPLLGSSCTCSEMAASTAGLLNGNDKF